MSYGVSVEPISEMLKMDVSDIEEVLEKTDV